MEGNKPDMLAASGPSATTPRGNDPSLLSEVVQSRGPVVMHVPISAIIRPLGGTRSNGK